MNTEAIGFLQTLESVIRQRLASGDRASYTAMLAAAGTGRIAQKVGEEGVELALAAVKGDNEEILGEAADLLYHMLVLLNNAGLSLEDVTTVLARRHQTAGGER